MENVLLMESAIPVGTGKVENLGNGDLCIPGKISTRMVCSICHSKR